MTQTKIEWADMTINPVVGCSKCSPGCDNCYAEKFAARLAKHPNRKIRGKYAETVDKKGGWNGTIVPWRPLEQLPKRPQRIFVGSMTDMLHENLDVGYIGEVLYLAARGWPQHTFMFLTKRAHRLADLHAYTEKRKWDFLPLPNVWFGVTVCNQAEADEKIPLLLQYPAAKRFVSVEPMLGPVDLAKYLCLADCQIDVFGDISDYTMLLNWVICGGETGAGSRPMNYAWVYKLAEQCWSANTPFFFKSWGEWTPAFYQPDGDYKVNPDADIPDGFKASPHIFPENPGIRMYKVGKHRSGCLLGREWKQFPEAGSEGEGKS